MGLGQVQRLGPIQAKRGPGYTAHDSRAYNPHGLGSGSAAWPVQALTGPGYTRGWVGIGLSRLAPIQGKRGPKKFKKTFAPKTKLLEATLVT